MNNLFIVCVILFINPIVAFAGGTDDINFTPSDDYDILLEDVNMDSSNSAIFSNSPASITNFDSNTGSSNFTGSNSVINQTSIESLTPLNQNTFGFSQSTSFSGSYNGFGLNNSGCGLNLYGNVNNSNTGLEQVYTAGFVWNQQKCLDEKELAELEAKTHESNMEAQKYINKVRSQEMVIRDCIRERSRAAMNKIHPDAICTIPDVSTFDEIN